MPHKKKRTLSKISTKKKRTVKRTKKFPRNVSSAKSKKPTKILRTKRKIQPRPRKKSKQKEVKKRKRSRVLSLKAQENKKARVSKRTKKNFKYNRTFKNNIKSFSRPVNENKWENLEGKKYKFRGNAVIDAENAWDRVKWLSELLYEKFRPIPSIKNEYDANKNPKGYVYGMGFLLNYQRYTDSSFTMQAVKNVKTKKGFRKENYEDKLTVISFADLAILEKIIFEKVIKALKTYNSITVILEGRVYRKSFSKKAKFPNTDYGRKA